MTNPTSRESRQVQPEALRWAGILEHQAHYDGPTDYKHKAAAELRRLHEVNRCLYVTLSEVRSDMEAQDVLFEWWGAVDAAIAKAKGESNE